MTTKTKFRRQESWRLKRVKENWRRPRGVTSRMRKEKNGWPAIVKVGRGSNSSKKGRHPKGLIEKRVRNEADLEGLNPALHIIRLFSGLGERRRLVLIERAKSLNIHIANPGKEETRPLGEEPKAAEPATPQEMSGQGTSAQNEIAPELQSGSDSSTEQLGSAE